MNPTEKRRTERLAHENTLFVQRISSNQVIDFHLPENPTEQSVGATIKNISPHGLQVVLEIEVLDDAELAMWMLLPNSEERILLTGNVQWVAQHEDGQRFRVGVALRDESLQAMARYQKLIRST